MKAAPLGEIVGKRSRIVGCQVDEKTFGDHKRILCAPVEALEQFPPRSAIGAIGGNSLEPAVRLVRAENLFLVGKQRWKIDLHPFQRGREIHPIWSGIKAGSD
jgi:hypothetical protein